MLASITKLMHQLKEHPNTNIIGTPTRIENIAGDASLRAYYRVFTTKQTYILMDSSQDPSFERFKHLTDYFLKNNFNVPKIFFEFADTQALLISDFGDNLYSELKKSEFNEHYLYAMETLVDLAAINPTTTTMPIFSDSLIQSQMLLFKEWYLMQYKSMPINSTIDSILSSLVDTFESVFKNAPQVIVHMDYHSRNLIKTTSHSPGLIDYQDARIGPIGYDAASLWFDAYIEHSDADIDKWVQQYLERLQAIPKFSFLTKDLLLEFCYMSGLQRLIKILGIFARLKIMYKKPAYEQYIPKVIKDINYILQFYPKLNDFKTLLSDVATTEVA
ncbi:MAG: phosphotransferase [Francisellaceae bacterium]|nr:phosphotransferase [Francisellaceae bacterium]MBT6538232.1 phosphotransferase [Francisellaceae bacterium]